MSRAEASSAPARAAAAEAGDALELTLRLTLLTLVLDPGIGWLARVPVLVGAGLGFLLPGAARSPWLWLGLGLWTGSRLWSHWPLPDNHAYLGSIWCLALFGALLAAQPAAALARSARLLLGLTFAFAMLWKAVLSPDFVNGIFFRVTLLEDSRFANLAVLAGGMSFELFDANEAARAAYHGGGVAWAEAGFVEPAALRRLATLLTLHTGVLETAIALCFLWPGSRGPARLRDPVLLLFCVTTFAVATVAGFGWLLAVLGAAQAAGRRTRLLYVACFFLILIYRSVPWTDWLVAAS